MRAGAHAVDDVLLGPVLSHLVLLGVGRRHPVRRTHDAGDHVGRVPALDEEYVDAPQRRNEPRLERLMNGCVTMTMMLIGVDRCLCARTNHLQERDAQVRVARSRDSVRLRGAAQRLRWRCRPWLLQHHYHRQQHQQYWLGPSAAAGPLSAVLCSISDLSRLLPISFVILCWRASSMIVVASLPRFLDSLTFARRSDSKSLASLRSHRNTTT